MVYRPSTKLKDEEDQRLSSVHKLVSLVGDDTLNFIKAKEEFKKSLSFSGILYR